VSNLTIWIEKFNKRSLLEKNTNQKEYDFLFEGGSAGCTYVFEKDMCEELKSTLKNIEFTGWTFLSHDWFVYFFARINNLNVYIDKQSNILYRIHENNVHGHMNTLSIKGILERVQLIRSGWYFNHIAGFLQLVKNDSKERYIYKMYSKNMFTRIYILLKYNFQLMRSSKKFIVFFLLSCLPVANKNKHLKHDL
jgi:rhamnosyltransferase